MTAATDVARLVLTIALVAVLLAVLIPIAVVRELLLALCAAGRRRLQANTYAKRRRVHRTGAYAIRAAESPSYTPRPCARPRPRPAVTDADRRLAAAVLARRRLTCERRRR